MHLTLLFPSCQLAVKRYSSSLSLSAFSSLLSSLLTSLSFLFNIYISFPSIFPTPRPSVTEGKSAILARTHFDCCAYSFVKREIFSKVFGASTASAYVVTVFCDVTWHRHSSWLSHCVFAFLFYGSLPSYSFWQNPHTPIFHFMTPSYIHLDS